MFQSFELLRLAVHALRCLIVGRDKFSEVGKPTGVSRCSRQAILTAVSLVYIPMLCGKALWIDLV